MMVEENVSVQLREESEHFAPWNKPDWKWWMFLDDNQEITHKWVVTFNQDAILSSQNYLSNESDEHAILVIKGTVTITDATITKTWDSVWDMSDFYWTNAAVISTDWILDLHNVIINTDWKHANAVFAYWNWEVNIWDSSVTTKDDNSWWIMVTWWWKLWASNVNVTTEWNSSAAIRSDRWGW